MATHKLDLRGVYMSLGDYENYIKGGGWTIQPIIAKYVLDQIYWIENYYAEEGDVIEVTHNSIGGDWNEGFQIRNAIIALNKKFKVLSIGEEVGSIATMPFLAVPLDQRFMMQGGHGFVHNPLAGMKGNADELQKAVNALREKEKEMASIYSEDTGLSVEEISLIMKEETLLSPSEMVEKGFASKVIDLKKEEITVGEMKISAILLNSCSGDCNILEKLESKEDKFYKQLIKTL